ncbi:Hypothetical predicted protein [Marmota monax]|uniref:Uncharacterized protein n=1 Tax=Marmota monax TaxID=9995 RepID=A0A5E4A7U2_MARMO|nr:Hypothetical predicted protein [Marmota monax]
MGIKTLLSVPRQESVWGLVAWPRASLEQTPWWEDLNFSLPPLRGPCARRSARRAGRTPESCAARGGAEEQPRRAAAGPGCDPSEPHALRGLTGRSPHGAAGPDRSC